MKRWILAAACGVAALGLLLYPLVGELLSEKYHSDIETSYTAAIKDTDDAELTTQWQAAQQYNAMLANATISEGGASAPPLAYAEQLTVGGVMAYVDIPPIGVYLPVQHGTGAETLEKSVGHVVGTSLPVGGSSTHAVLSAHSGMASSKLFSDIDQLEKGDVFYIHVLGDTLAYEVDAINTVLPTDTSLLQIEDGKDLVTLALIRALTPSTSKAVVLAMEASTSSEIWMLPSSSWWIIYSLFSAMVCLSPHSCHWYSANCSIGLYHFLRGNTTPILHRTFPLP